MNGSERNTGNVEHANACYMIPSMFPVHVFSEFLDHAYNIIDDYSNGGIKKILGMTCQDIECYSNSTEKGIQKISGTDKEFGAQKNKG
ncbi:hypothetical protein BPIT_04930 [Candidatus Brocadia pituitae]|nr:hypothetical protein BPIT_04930 [Candidatus Brocadia pituitae]